MLTNRTSASHEAPSAAVASAVAARSFYGLVLAQEDKERQSRTSRQSATHLDKATVAGFRIQTGVAADGGEQVGVKYLF